VSGFCIGYPDPEHPTGIKPRLPIEAVLHRDCYLDDETMKQYMVDCDQSLGVFYESQGMHDRDPRWTHVMSGRVGRFHQRADLDVFLKRQGYDWQS